jgi:hypothetical protein
MLSVLFSIVAVIVLILIILVVAKEHQMFTHNARQSLAYPDAIPGPPNTEVVNGVDTSMLPSHIHDEDTAIDTAMLRSDDFASSIDTNNLSKGTSGLDNGYPGFENNRSLVFADKNA